MQRQNGSVKEGTSKQEFGTVWIQNTNGVHQMVQVLQVTPTKGKTTGQSSLPAVVRAVVHAPGVGAQPASLTSVRTAQPAVLSTPPRVAPVVCASTAEGRPAVTPPGAVAGVRLVAGVSAAAARSPATLVLHRKLQPQPASRSTNSATLDVGSPGSRSQMQGGGGRGHAPEVGSAADRPSPAGSPPGRSAPSPWTPELSPGCGRSAKRAADPPQLWSDSKRRRYERNAKGLRHFSMKVCQKVRAKGTTTYNEVADELVAELCPPGAAASPDQQYEQKNIRRRVYDALNVLMAMQIISKERKRIQWLGLPAPPAEDSPNLEQEKADCRQRISEKTQQLKDLVLRQIAFKNLVERNKALEETEGPPEAGSSVQLPFLVVNTKKKTVIDCSISSDKKEYLFNFSDTFEIHDDIEVLKRMGMTLGLDSGTSSEEDFEKAATMLPPSLAAFIEQAALEAAGASEGTEPSPDRPDRPLDQLEMTWESP